MEKLILRTFREKGWPPSRLLFTIKMDSKTRAYVTLGDDDDAPEELFYKAMTFYQNIQEKINEKGDDGLKIVSEILTKQMINVIYGSNAIERVGLGLDETVKSVNGSSGARKRWIQRTRTVGASARSYNMRWRCSTSSTRSSRRTGCCQRRSSWRHIGSSRIRSTRQAECPGPSTPVGTGTSTSMRETPTSSPPSSSRRRCASSSGSFAPISTRPSGPPSWIRSRWRPSTPMISSLSTLSSTGMGACAG
ncbi:hypothetical protein VTN77DRAFT_2179 [Rasamsonia byssochlamydoides]|uniref:uncharacterized protein n=1 Tax=Rasamsonia byssochlamydoides TaxID=89139 RepID=UPI003744AABE